MDRATHSNTTLLAQVLAMMIPLWLAGYWIIYINQIELAKLVFRPGMLGLCCLQLFFWYRMPFTVAEKKLVALLSLFCAAILVTALAAADLSTAMQEWIKLALLCFTPLPVCRALRQNGVARAFGIGCIAASASVGAMIVLVYVRHMGLVWPGYTAVRVFKSVANDLGIPFNPISFICVVSYLCGMCLVRGNRWLYALGLLLVLISTILTGSRTPLATIVVSAVILLIMNAAKSRSPLTLATGWLMVILLLAAPFVAAIQFSDLQLNDFTEHRWMLWQVGLEQFTGQPIFGNGSMSWYPAISSAIPTGHLVAGAYHNEFVTALAEHGTIGFIALCSLFAFLIHSAWKLAFSASLTWECKQWALFGALVIFMRALVEVPGLLGYSQEPADFFAYMFLAVVVSRFSAEEDFCRLSNRVARPHGQKFHAAFHRQPALSRPMLRNSEYSH